jgi:hypothetical protein
MAALLDAGADASAADGAGDTAMHVAAAANAHELVTLLLSRSPAPAALLLATGAAGRSPMHVAAAAGATACVVAMCAAGADAAHADASGCTPLHAAAQAGDEAAVLALLAVGANAGMPAVPMRNNVPVITCEVDGPLSSAAPATAPPQASFVPPLLIGAPHRGSWSGCGGNAASGVARSAGAGNCGTGCVACGAGTNWSCCGSSVRHSDCCIGVDVAQASANAAACFARAASPCRVAQLPGARFPLVSAAATVGCACGNRSRDVVRG